MNQVSTVVPDCRHDELTGAMKRLARANYLIIMKWEENRQFVQYQPGVTDDGSFIYSGIFRLKITDQGRPYLDGLQCAQQDLSGGQRGLQSTRRLRQ